MEFVAANTYSMLLIIGNPTNIYLSSIFDLTFVEYLKFMTLPVIINGIVSFSLLYLLFRKQLSKKIEIFDLEAANINNRFVCIVSLIHLGLATILLAVANYIDIEMWIISLSFMISLCTILIVYSFIKRNF